MSHTRRISRFALVGVLIAALYIVLYLAFLHIGMPRGAANVAAFGLAIVAQYGGCLITGLIAPTLALDDWFAAAAVTVILPVQNFILMTLWVFSHPST